LEAAYVFGSLGNLSSALVSGWSVEEAFAWAVGNESILRLPFSGEDSDHVLRFDIHPAVFPKTVEQQRMTVMAGEVTLGSFALTERATVAIDLPAEAVRGRDCLELRLLHPDAARPSDHIASPDRRWLSLCFHSGALSATATQPADAASAPGGGMLEPVHGLIAGDMTAMRIKEIIARLPSLAGRVGVRLVDFGRPLNAAFADMPPDTLATAGFCWIETSAGIPAVREGLREMLPAACDVKTFYTPVSRALWPFQGTDRRAVAEPGRYMPARYPFGDRLAVPLTAMNMPDDVVYLMYEMSAEQDATDLDALMANDLKRWRAADAASDIRLAGFIERGFAADRLFISPRLPGPALIREMTLQILDIPAVRDLVRPDALAAELDALLGGRADWIWDFTPDKFNTVATTPGLQAVAAETMRVAYIDMDSAGRSGPDNPLTKTQVRQAIAMAIDRAAIVKQYLLGQARVLDTPCYPTQFGCDQSSAADYDYNPAKARQLLADAGYASGFPTELVSYLLPEWTVAVQTYLKAVGIDASIAQLPVADALRRNAEGESPMSMGSWGSYSINDVSAFMPYFFAGGPNDYTRDPAIEALVRQGGSVTDLDQRRKAYSQAIKLITAPAYFLPLFSYVKTYGFSRSLAFKPSPDELPRFYLSSWKPG